MKILLYSVNFAPEPTGIGKYSGEMAAWLVKQGHSVRVVAAPPYYPNWKVDPEYRWHPYRRDSWQGVEVFRAPLWVPADPGGTARVIHLLSFALLSIPVLLRQLLWRADLVLTVAPAIVCAPAGWITARLSGAEAWLHIQDFEVDVAFRMGLLKGNLMKRAFLAAERWLFARFDTVSTISGPMLSRLLTKGVKPEDARYFPNWVDISHIRPAAANERYREELGISPDAVVFLYSGSLGSKQGLMAIPAVARRLVHRKDLVFVVCGNGALKPELEAASADLPNVRFLPLQPFERLGELLCMADVHLLTQSSGAADLVLPSKLSGMLASGRPVIATCEADTELAAVVSACGVVVPPEDVAALGQAVCQLADEPRLRVELGKAARLFAEHHFEANAILRRVFGSLATGNGAKLGHAELGVHDSTASTNLIQ
jgi:colanic acid biosynthesis glycosyl transferase WcaI